MRHWLLRRILDSPPRRLSTSTINSIRSNNHKVLSPLYEAPNEKQLPVQVRERLHKAEDAYGFIPNFLQVYSRRSEEFSAFFKYYDTLITSGKGNLTRMEREMISLVTSAQQGCMYCAIAHSGFFNRHSDKTVKPEQLMVNWQQADITDRQKAILTFAMGVKVGKQVSKNEINGLKSHGLNSDDAWDIVAIMGLTMMSGYMAQLMGVKPNEEFYKMGIQKH